MIRHIASYTPKERGRMERVFGTLQQRLSPQSRRASLLSIGQEHMAAARGYLPGHSARFAREAAEPQSAFAPCAGIALEDVLCVREDRQVGRENCVTWRGQSQQIPEQHHRRHYTNSTSDVRHYPVGRIAIFDGPRRLAGYEADGTPIDETIAQAA